MIKNSRESQTNNQIREDIQNRQDENTKSLKKRQRGRILFRIATAVIWLTILVLWIINRELFTVDGLRNSTPDKMLPAILCMLLIFALKSMSIFIYSGILFTVSGLLFPVPVAILVNILGTVIMVSIPYFIGNRTGYDAVDNILKNHPKMNGAHNIRKENDFKFTLFVRMMGILPSDIVSLYMGAVGVKFDKYLIGCVLGFLPSVITFPIMGMSVKDMKNPAFWISAVIEVTAMIISLFFCIRMKKKYSSAKSEDEAQKKKKSEGQ